jgi:hypothetical protein
MLLYELIFGGIGFKEKERFGVHYGNTNMPMTFVFWSSSGWLENNLGPSSRIQLGKTNISSRSTNFGNFMMESQPFFGRTLGNNSPIFRIVPPA